MCDSVVDSFSIFKLKRVDKSEDDTTVEMSKNTRKSGGIKEGN